jgi:hypothetical protein
MIYRDHAASTLSDRGACGARQQPGPVVAAACGLAGSWRIPFVRQIHSDSTSAGHHLPNQPAPLAATGPRLAEHPAGIVHWR